MSLVHAKCTQCGANLEVDKSKDAAICPYCGAAFITEKAINNYNIANIQHADINAEKVVVNVKKHDDSLALRYKKTKGGWYINSIDGEQAEKTGGITIPATFKGEPILWVKEGAIIGAFLDYILVDSANKYIRMEGGCLINNETNTVVTINGDEIHIPEGVTAIGESAFWKNDIKEIHIPSSVKRIGKDAFGYVKDIKVYIDDLNSWCEIDFENERANPLYNNGEESSELYVNGEKIGNKLVIPDGITKIGNYAFAGYMPLTEVVISDSVESIGQNAFWWCKNLSKLTYGKNLKFMGIGAFGGNITQVNIPDIKSWIEADNTYVPYDMNMHVSILVNGEKLTEVVFPEGITKIRDNVLYGFGDVQSVKIPNSVTSIGKSAFMLCKKLESVVIPSGVTTIEEDTFRYCANLKSVVLPEGLKTIGLQAFTGCVSLEEISIPSTVIDIGAWAFGDCKSLKSIVLPDGITVIKKYAFYGCEKLSNIEIPEGVTSIQDDAFEYCKNLHTAYIPYSVMEIGERAFYACNLSKVRIGESVNLGKNVFEVYSYQKPQYYERCSEQKIKKHRPSKKGTSNTGKNGKKIGWGLFALAVVVVAVIVVIKFCI